MTMIVGFHLTNAANLSNDRGPPQTEKQGPLGKAKMTDLNQSFIYVTYARGTVIRGIKKLHQPFGGPIFPSSQAGRPNHILGAQGRY